MPRPIPTNPELITGWRYFLVALPNHDDAVAAGWDAFSALMNDWEWGLEGIESDSSVMAQVWADALFETIRIRTMGFPDAVLDYIDEIETLLQGLQQIQQVGAGCCDNLSPINEGHVYDDSNYPDTPPATWGGETVADSADWQELVCGAAHAYVDHLIAMSQQIELLVGIGGVVIGAVGALLALGAGAGILLGIAYGTAASITSGLVAAATVGLFGAVADDLEDARTAIVCAIVGPTSSAEALALEVQLAISASAWSLFYQYVDYASARNIMLEGGHGSESLPVARSTTCDCELDLSPFELVHKFKSPTAAVGGFTPTWTEPGDYSQRVQWNRTDALSTSFPLKMAFNLTTLSCAAHGASTAHVTLRVSGTWLGGTGHNSDTMEVYPRWLREEDSCPLATARDMSEEDSPETDVTDGNFFLYDLTFDIDIATGGDWREYGVGFRISEWANDIDITAEIRSVTYS